MKLTLPQLTMMNHAAWASQENSTRRYEAKKLWDEERDRTDPKLPEYGGKRLSEIKSDPAKMDHYLTVWSGFQ